MILCLDLCAYSIATQNWATSLSSFSLTLRWLAGKEDDVFYSMKPANPLKNPVIGQGLEPPNMIVSLPYRWDTQRRRDFFLFFFVKPELRLQNLPEVPSNCC